MLPNLIHPIPVTVERFQPGRMLMDHDVGEPVHGPRGTQAQTFTIDGQVRWRRQEDPTAHEGGVREADDGYVLVRVADMDAILGAGQRLDRGDRISALGAMTGLDLYITRKEPAGHYPDQGGASLIRYWFADRKPVRQTVGAGSVS